MSKVVIIAEAGVNHNGDLKIAKELIETAASAGADYVKFQTFKADKLASFEAETAGYQRMRTGSVSQYDLLKHLELDFVFHKELIQHCKNSGINFLSTAFDLESIELLKSFSLGVFKIPSGEITNLPYLRAIGTLGGHVILSTGMCTLKEIENALNILIQSGTAKKSITVLHCTTQYPTPYSDVNLRAILNIKEKLDVQVGYSDHTLGIEVPIAAVVLGATIIEKHFTLSRDMPGPDHKASLEPRELKAMVDSIRNIEHAISGSGLKEPTKSEIENRDLVRKSIHIVNSMAKGQKLKTEDLIMLRPGNGISPMELDAVVGRKISSDLFANHQLSWSDLK